MNNAKTEQATEKRVFSIGACSFFNKIFMNLKFYSRDYKNDFCYDGYIKFTIRRGRL